MVPRFPDRPVTVYDDDFEDIPSSGPVAQYGGGVALPLMLVGYGIVCIIRRHAVLSGGRISLDLDGTKAVALATATIALGTFLHCHYFWGNIYHLSAWAVVGKILSAIAFIGGLGFLIVRVGVLGH